MTPFLVSVVVIQCVLLFAMYAAVAQLLARVRRTEALLGQMVNPIADVAIVLGEPLPTPIAAELGPIGGSAILHLSSGNCRSCRAHVAAIADDGRQHIVITASPDELDVLTVPDQVGRATSPTLLTAVRSQQMALPITIEVADGTVIDVRRDTTIDRPDPHTTN